MILLNCLLKPPLHLDFLKHDLNHVFPQQRQASLFLNHTLFYIHGSYGMNRDYNLSIQEALFTIAVRTVMGTAVIEDNCQCLTNNG